MLATHTKKHSSNAISLNNLQRSVAAAYKAAQYPEAFGLICECIFLDPSNATHKIRLGDVLQKIRLEIFHPKSKRAILACLKSHAVGYQKFVRPWMATLQQDPAHKNLMALWEQADFQAFEAAMNWRSIQTSLQDDFLLYGMRCLMIQDPNLEKLLTHWRRWLLSACIEQPALLRQKNLPFLSALAENCFLNEYVFIETPEEVEKVNMLLAMKDPDAIQLAVLASYKPLYKLPQAGVLAEKFQNGPLAALIKLQITEPMEEERSKADILSVGSIQDNVSEKVRDMYEHNPYPRWNAFDIPQVPRAELKGDWLIAGCGTGRTLVQAALIFPGVDFTGVDISHSSLAYGMRKTEELSADNISFVHADILEIPTLNKQFDVIESSGVLHHMAEPVEGWRQLLKCLKPGGIMHIGLYSALARETIRKGQKYVVEKSYQPTPEGIRSFRTDVLALPSDHSLKGLSEITDFYSLSDCRDLIFHVQEKNYTIPELQGILDELDLAFLGWRMNKPDVQQAYKIRYPGDTAMTNLSYWDELEKENPNIFIGMYQFICCRKSEADQQNETTKALLETGFFLQ